MEFKEISIKYSGAMHLRIYLIYKTINISPLCGFSKKVIVKTGCSAPEYL